jgi:hypothetical protein
MNTPTDWRALCAELHAALEKRCETLEEDRLLDRSAAALRTALAQPEPVGPTDDELWLTADDEFRANVYPTDAIRFARAVLARWGRPAIEPVPEEPTVMQIIALADEVEAEELGQVDLVRHALTRWGRPALPLPTNEQ